MTGRGALASGLVAVLVLGACGATVRPTQERPADPPLALDPLADLVSAAGLVWLVDARPSAIATNEDAAEGAAALPTAPLDLLARDGSGLDWHQATELVIAGFPDATLWLVRAPFDPLRVERAFGRAAVAVEGRTEERGVTRFWGTVDGARTQVALFGRSAVAIERGRFGPLQVAAYFAQRRLRRSLPAMRAAPLSEVAERVGEPEAPLRVFAPGPFEGGAATGLGGLLRAATAFGGRFAIAPAIAASAGERPSMTPPPAERPPTRPSGTIEARVVLTGAWGPEWRNAAERLDAIFRVIAEDSLGHLLGLDRPSTESRTTGDATAVELDLRLDAHAMATGLRAATTASLSEILGKPDEPTLAH
jgi:hypothetical protein